MTTAPGIRKALAIIRLLAVQTDGLGFNQMRSDLDGLPASTLSRLLRVLVEEGWVRHAADGRYQLGPGAWQTIDRAVALRADDEALIAAAVEALAAATGESAAFTVWAGDGFLFRYKHEMPESYHYLPLGQLGTDVFVNGFGTVNCAWQDDDEIMRQIRRHGVDPVATRARLEALRAAPLYTVRDRGLRFIAPVHAGAQRAYRGALGVTCSLRDLEPEAHQALGAAVLAQAQALTRRLTPDPSSPETP